MPLGSSAAHESRRSRARRRASRTARKQTMPSDGGAISSSVSLASIRRARAAARSSVRSIAARNASTPKYRSEIQSLSARPMRVSCRPWSEKLTSLVGRRARPAGSRGAISNARRSAWPVAHEHAAALERLVEPLVRVERDRVGELDAPAARAAALGQRREAAVGPVDVQPDAVLAAELGELGSGSTAPVFVAPAARRDEQRRRPARDVGLDRRGERAGREPERVVDRQHAHLAGRKPSTRAARASEECAWSET